MTASRSSCLGIGRKTSDETATFYFKNRTRFIMLVLVTLCLSICQSNVLTLNFTIICMAGPPLDITPYNQSGNIHRSGNGSYFEVGDSGLADYELDMSNRPYVYTASEKNMLFSFVAVGAMVAVYPCMLLIQRFGSRNIVTIFGFFSAFCTALVPLCADLGFAWLVVIRFFQGTGLSPGFTLIGIFTLQWSMMKQNAFFIAVLTCLFQIGPIFTMPIAGALCTSSLGWQSVYYLHAIVTCILYIIFLYFYRELPDRHRLVSEKEIDRIKRMKSDTTKREPVPLRAMLTSPAILSCWASGIGNFIGIQLTMQFSPTYLNRVMGFPVEQTGLFSAIPQIVTFCLKLVAGVMADKMVCCAPVTSVKIFNSLAIGGMGIFFFIVAYVPTTEPLLALIVLIICTSIVGFNCGAFFKSSAIVAAQHNHFVMGVNSFINCACALLAPVIVNIFVKDDTWDEWWWVWVVHGIILTVVNIIFLVFGKGEPAEWTKKKIPDDATGSTIPRILDPESSCERIQNSSSANKIHPEPLAVPNVAVNHEESPETMMRNVKDVHRF
ncbi:unnamed protein product [Auanema sp. JU1783]|nr:unnamed protein product [Auanema sp. JU1783]